jgi:spermidine synthase
VRRDFTATVISCGQGQGRSLLVNGIGMTMLTPITKFMVHLPLAYHQGTPQSALVICFGMGTSYRSAMNWNIDATVVELVPSVTKAFGYYHADAERFVNATNGHIITDDGRRFLKRTAKKFDVIVVDPPPPVQAAGSSLLFSSEFYALAKQHLNSGGILQMWYPGDDEAATTKAVLRSFADAFPHVHCFPSVEGWGIHMLGSMEPMAQLNAKELAARMPESARQDLLEWTPVQDAPTYLSPVLSHEYSVPASLDPDTTVRVTDDQPFNEYYLLRRLLRFGDNSAPVHP